MQEIPTFIHAPSLDIVVFISTIVFLVLLVIIVGNRNRATDLLYWVIAAIEVTIFSVSWLFLYLLIDMFVWTHANLPTDDKPIGVNVLSALLFLGLCALLVFIETHRGTPRPSG